MMSQEILSGKLLREFKTIAAMVHIYCKDHCPAKGDVPNCPECSEFLEYAHTRLDRCPYGQDKPTCNKCPVHCYKPEPKAKAREIMIYAGPRMLLPHPIMAIRHLWAERGPVPGKPPAAASNRHLRLAKEKQQSS
ncbi:nitrous oxide-stimulated promoter family protein [Shewanella sp. cp20]|uniref:nitrous oxide-stimulated promoter family protein n=2 Tax=Shewanellaceae TaxID=267890 RepID=UPI00190F22DB|nr:nitrous oxide-stimulated promoter family protein [Shewanella sp. cp20]MCG9748130.1 nitrous oxide-stimulated promoter family protein [Shewanella sp. Isolate8]MCL2911687.1 nitrous oxide-stimulated promoter family protein [Shewanella aquimarina]